MLWYDDKGVDIRAYPELETRHDRRVAPVNQTYQAHRHQDGSYRT